MGIKKCSKCWDIKNIEEFTKDNQKKDWLRSSCKLCNKRWLTRKEISLKKKVYIEKTWKQICFKCKKNLSITEFRKDNSKITWYYPSCNDCYRKDRWITKMVPQPRYNCDECWKEFWLRVEQRNNKKGKVYCSRKCEMENNIRNRKGRYYWYRKYIKERDWNKCVISWDTENLHIHHIITRWAWWTNEYRNLITLSAKVHREKAHWMELEKYRKKFLEYTSQFDRPDYWDEVMYKSKLDEDSQKKLRRKQYRNT